jgi:hypothetical protein
MSKNRTTEGGARHTDGGGRVKRPYTRASNAVIYVMAQYPALVTDLTYPTLKRALMHAFLLGMHEEQRIVGDTIDPLYRL